MISYISLLIAFISAVIGAFIEPHKKSAEGRKVLNKWSFLFVLIPLVSMTVAGISHYDSQKESERLKQKIEESIDRVDAYEVQVTYIFSLKDAGYSKKINKLIKDVLPFYSAITKDENGNSQYGIAKDMYGQDRIDVEDYFLELIDRNIQEMRNFSGPTLFVKRKNNGKSLEEIVNSAIGFGLLNVAFEKRKISSSVAIYNLINPRLINNFPPGYIAESMEYWIIPDKDSVNPKMHLTWKFRIFSNPAADLRLLNDFRNAEFMLLAPRIYPDYDSAPSLGAFNKRFGQVQSVSVAVGGLKYGWNEKDSDFVVPLTSPKREAKDPEYIGQLVKLRKL